VAAAAPARALDAIYRAARDAGWEIQTVVPAEQAWRAAALELWPRLRRGTGHVVIAHAGRTDVLRLDDGTLTGARRFRALSSDLAQVYESIAGGDAPSASSAVAVLGDPAARVALARELSRGDALLPEPSTSIPAAESAELAAAAFASRGAGLELLPEQALRARRERMRGVTIAAAVAAGVLLALAAALELWGVQRELEQVRRERNALRPRVADVAVTRELATSTSRIVEDLASEEQSGTRWSDVIATVASALPRDAHLTALRVEGDSLTIEGLADRAANVFAAVERARGLDGVRSAAPVRRDFRDLEDQRERFSLAARAAPTAPRETDTITTAASRP
jgi:Tfp pilus assembly protein PilN